MGHGPYTKPAAAVAEGVTVAECDAYVAIEECRLRCEQLVAIRSDIPTLQHIHRDFGLAGYHVSSQLDQEARRLFLAQAHAQCDGGLSDADAALRELDIAVDCAMVAIEHALDATVLADHAHLAQIHLLDADGALKDLTHRPRR